MENQAEDFSGYDDGFRRGTFDKCNGRDMYAIENVADSVWVGGYLDGWEGNEVRIMKECEPGEFSSAEPPSDVPTDVFFRLWVEWDFGQDDHIFNEEATAKAWLGRALVSQYETVEDAIFSLLDEEHGTVENLFDAGLAGFHMVTLITE